MLHTLQPFYGCQISKECNRILVRLRIYCYMPIFSRKYHVFFSYVMLHI